MAYAFELLTVDQRVSRLRDRLRQLEDELFNAQVSLEVDSAVYTEEQNANLLAAHRTSVEMAGKRIVAVRKMLKDLEASDG